MSSSDLSLLQLPPFSAHTPSQACLRIALGERSYPIRVGSLDWAACAEQEGLAGPLAVLVTNPVVGALYGAGLEAALKGRYARVERLVVPDGEVAKDWGPLQGLLSALADLGADRQVAMFALGGGVVGDLTGFAASIYMRGVRFLQVPTTLLAQVDSSVGGKTGINLAQGKNLVGAFYQPEAVWADLAVLDSLPPREFAAGLAEVIKYGPIADAAFYDWLETHMDALVRREREALVVAVRRSCEIKAAVVAADEREGGVRAILNFGHTFGHALEAGLGYGQLLHGEAVALGMLMAMDLSVAAAGLDRNQVERLRALLARAGLPVQAPYLEPREFLRLMRGDKKSSAGTIRYVLVPEMGRARLVAVADEAARLAIEEHSEAPPQ